MWIGTAFAFLKSKIGQYAMIAFGVLLAILAIFRAGKKSERNKQKVKNLETYVDTNKKAREAQQDAARKVGSIDDDDLNERLRRKGRLRD